MAKQKGNKQKQAAPVKAKPAKTDSGLFTWLVRNGAVALVFLVLGLLFWNMFSDQRKLNELTAQFYQLQSSNPRSPELKAIYDEVMQLQPQVIGDTGFLKRFFRGYHWAIHDLAFGNLASIEKSKEELAMSREDSTPQSLFEAKMKRKVGLYSFFQDIKRLTPDTAVILLPAGDSAVSNNAKWNFIYEPGWSEFFLYPRLCVTIGNEKDMPELAKRATHVVIIEGKGYDKLHYNVPMEQRVQEAVLPINAPPGIQNPKP